MLSRPPGTDPSGIVLRFPVAPEQAGQRLDRFIQGRIPRLSRTRAKAIVQSCAYRWDGRRRRGSERVRAGEIVVLVRPPMDEPEAPDHFDVLYEDDVVLVVDKPPGLAVHPTATYHKHTLWWLLRERYGEPTPQLAHRLDRDTSGVLVCGRTPEAERSLKRAFEDRRVDKRYTAIVRGEMPEDAGVMDASMAPAREGLHVLMEVRADGLDALTEYRVLERAHGRTLVSLHPRTGRQHQLRVHLAALGYPIVGDKLYGPEGSAPFEEYIAAGMEISRDLLERLGHRRQALHAAWIRFPHPETGAPVEVESPLPADMRLLWARSD